MDIKSQNTSLHKLMNYKIWADHITYDHILKLPPSELTKVRDTNFKTIAHTLNHIYVVEDIFKAHLTGQKHGYDARNTKETPPIEKLWNSVQLMNDWYLNIVHNTSQSALSEVIEFEFVGGGMGKMSREDIILHIVNHATYHRGFVSDLMYQIPVNMPSNDYPVFLRDVWNK
ncbi:MAG: DinB family protein [Proteobacteria bacterium]|nr:DinB family protein [Pseudomonadota bacterium]